MIYASIKQSLARKCLFSTTCPSRTIQHIDRSYNNAVHQIMLMN